ncbi:PaaI family thioesterase [Paenibacillus hodogayensis]|uniref:PaaI family thioesterase n=1 Tax=Paenibacillus hodogayensis TaxID=279208 RepID=A0ABV5W3W9_9BACL
MTDSDLERFVSRLAQAAAGTFWEELGCELEHIEPGRTVIVLEAGARHLNGIGMLHGGVHASLLDQAMGITAMAARPDDKVVTSHLNIHYLFPLAPGKVTVSAELIHQTRRMLTVSGKVEDCQGRIGSWGSGSFRVLADDAPKDGKGPQV